MKKLLAAAIAAAFVAPVAASANSTIVYGKVHLDIINDDNGSDSVWEVTSNATRLGFKGTEDLGNGMKVIWKYEMTYSGVDSTVAIGSARNSYIGLAADFGTFIVGRHDTPEKVAFYANGNERLGDSIIDLNKSIDGNPFFTERRVNNAIAYISPNFSGVTVAAAAVPGEQRGGNDGLADSYSIGAMYKGMGIKASAGYESVATGGEDDTLWMVGATYTINGMSVGAVYEDRSDIGGTADYDKKSWAITGKYSFGNNAVSIVYSDMTVEQAGMNDKDADRIGIALENNLSKRTKVYIAYNDMQSEQTGSADVESKQYGVGMIHNF